MRHLVLILLAVGLALVIYGGLGVYDRLVYGHRLTAYGSYATWGLWVAAYIYFIGLSAGAFLFSSLIYVFGVKRLAMLGRTALYIALTTLIMALGVIWMDIGHMERVWEFVVRPNFTSMMNNMIWMYSAYFAILLAEFVIVSRPTLSVLQPLSRAGLTPARLLYAFGLVGVPLATLFHGGVGALFAVIGARPYWFSALFPVLFLSGALLSGGALLTFIVAYFWPHRNDEHRTVVNLLGRLVLMMLLFFILFEWAEFSIPWWSGLSGALGVHIESVMLVLTGPFWWVFWIVHILIGVAVPLILLTAGRRSVRLVGLAGLLIAMTFMGVRLNSVIPGAVTVELRGLEEAVVHERLVFYYFPTVHEWQVVFFMVGVGVLLMVLGMTRLNLFQKSDTL